MLLSTLPLYALAAFAAILTIGTILGIYLNTIVIAIYWSDPTLRTRSTQLFLILAITDLTVGLTVGPFHIAPLLSERVATSKWYDKLRIFTTAATISMSVYTIVVIAFDRMMTLRRLNSPTLSAKQITLIVLGLLLIATAAPTCRLLPGHAAEIVYLTMATCTAAISIGGVITSYCVLIHIVRQHHLTPGVSHSERRTTQITIRLTLTYIISLTPMIFYHLMRFTDRLPENTLDAIYAVALIIISSTCYTNPWSYYFSNPTLRSTYVATVHRNQERSTRHREAQLL